MTDKPNNTMNTEIVEEKPFEFGDIEDVRIIIKTKNGKHYGIVPKRKVFTDEETRKIRILLLQTLLEYHYVVDTALEDLHNTQNKQQ